MPSFAVPLLSRPPSGAIDLARSVIVNGNDATPLIELSGDPGENEGLGFRWAHLHAGIDLRSAGRTPNIAVDFADWLQSVPPEGNRLYWRRTGETRDQWRAFDHHAVAGSRLTVWNDNAFDIDRIEVALTPPFAYADMLDWIDAHASSAFVHVPPSAARFNAQNPAAHPFAYYTFPPVLSANGTNVGGVHALCFRITDPESRPLDGSAKRTIVCDWTDAGAHPALRLLFSYAAWLLGGTEAAATARRLFDHYFYLANTAGLFGGMARGAVEAADPLLIAAQTIEMR